MKSWSEIYYGLKSWSLVNTMQLILVTMLIGLVVYHAKIGLITHSVSDFYDKARQTFANFSFNFYPKLATI